MTIKEFWESSEKLAIHCDTEEKAKRLLKKFDELGKKWSNGYSYLEYTNWQYCEKNTCYDNKGQYGDIGIYFKFGFTIIEFDELDDFKNKNQMTSKEVLNHLKNAYDSEHYPMYEFVSECELDKIKKDLEILDIIKKYLYYDNKNHFIKMKPIRKSIYNFDYEDLKEWLENE